MVSAAGRRISTTETAEDTGFEPVEVLPSPDFESGAIDRTLPILQSTPYGI